MLFSYIDSPMGVGRQCGFLTPLISPKISILMDILYNVTILFSVCRIVFERRLHAASIL